jgi:hypothetical protein
METTLNAIAFAAGVVAAAVIALFFFGRGE